MRKAIFFCLIIFACLASPAYGQDPAFSQFYAAPLWLNPAFAGVTYAPRLTANYRNQWPNWPSAYNTYALSYEQPLEEYNSGLGVLLLADNAGNGIYRTLNINAVYSYQIKINKDFRIKLGLEGGLYQYRLDWEQLLFGDQLDPIDGAGGDNILTQEQRPERLSNSTIDMGAGLLVYSPKYYLGLSLKHLNRPNESLLEFNENLSIGRPLHISVHAGAQFPLPFDQLGDSPPVIVPNLLYNRQAGFSQLNVGSYISIGAVFTGAWFRWSGNNADALVGLLGFRYELLRIGYSYDTTMGPLSGFGTGGAHEVSVSINFGETSRSKRSRKRAQLNDCFLIFN